MEALRWPLRPGFYRPDFARCLTGVMPTLFELLGHAPAGYPALRSYLPPGSPRRARRVLLLCLDAFGFKELAQARRFPALYGAYGTWITSVFPTITSCALTSLYQALPPGRHCVPGHVIWKDFPGALVDMLRMAVPGADASLQAAGVDVNGWKREPGILERPPGDGLPCYQLLERTIMGSGLSALIYGATPLVGFNAPLEGFTKAAAMLKDMEQGWVGLYLDAVDALGHVLTGDGPQMGLIVRHIEESLAWMAGTLPPDVVSDTALMVVADHGQSTVRERLPLYGKTQAWLDANTRAVGNSGRVLHVYLRPEQHAPVLAWLREFVGSRGAVFAFEEVKGLLGPPFDGSADATAEHEAWVRRSLGDLVVMLDDGYNWQRRDPNSERAPYPTRLVSQHGSLAWDEVFVPFLCVPLAALVDRASA